MRWMNMFNAPEPGQKSTGLGARFVYGAAAIAALATGSAVGEIITHNADVSHAAPITAVAPPNGAPFSFADIAAQVKPAVVSVRVHVVEDQPAQVAQGDEENPFGDLFRHFGLPYDDAPQQPREGQALGSGFFVSSDGYIVTNNHVVQHGKELSVTLDDGRTFSARVVAVDERTDLALIKTDSGDHFPFVRFAEDAPRVGDWVLAVGNPFGLGGTVTAGIVSAHGRDLGEGPYDDFLQIDAPVNQGNSGGPAFNLKGEVVGINTAIYSPSGGNVGIAFAIPASSAAPIVDALEHGGQVVRGYLGVTVQALDDDLAHSMGLRDHVGALVANVSDGSPAARAGLRNGDVIVRAGDAQVNDSRDLARIVASHRPGAHLDIEYIRAGHHAHANATLIALPANAVADQTAPQQDGPSSTAGQALGLTLAPARDGVGLQVLAVEPGSDAEARGLTRGDVIVEAGGRPCRSIEDLTRAADAAKQSGRGAVLLRVETQNASRYVGLPLANNG